MPLNINNLTAGTPVTFNAQTSVQRMVFDSSTVAFRIVNNTTGIVTVMEENSDSFICQVNPGATAFGLMQNAILVKAQYAGSITLTPYTWVPASVDNGTYTPVITGADQNPVGTYIKQVGKWTKIGNRVILDVDVILDCQTTQILGDGAMRCSLPFVANQSIITVGNYINLTQPYLIGGITPFIDVVNYGSYLYHYMFADGENRIVWLGDDLYNPFYAYLSIQSHIEYFVS